MPDERYKQFYIDRPKDSKSLYLDNGLIELGHALSCDELYNYAMHIAADFVFSPDILGDWLFNWRQAEDFTKLWPREATIVTLAGSSALAFEEQCEWVISHGFAGVALPYRRNRNNVVRNSKEMQHLFGFKGLNEHFNSYKPWSTIDTVAPINAALRGFNWRKMGLWDSPRHVDYRRYPFDQGTADNAIDNITWLKERINATTR
jgi:hypothetical protein